MQFASTQADRHAIQVKHRYNDRYFFAAPPNQHTSQHTEISNRRTRLDVYKTEEEQLETIKKWWNENGKSALFGIILGLGGIFGWRAWQANIISQADAASDLYQQSLVAVNQNFLQQAKDFALQVTENYEKTGYAVFARLILAHLAAAETDYTAAAVHLNWALDNVKVESLKHEIRIRLARVYIADNKLDQAFNLINTSQPGSFSPIYNELKGDILVLQNKPAEARMAYQQAILAAQTSSVDESLLNVKLDALGN
jgi:predicted negative regulator of RcsB-dependent stress response